MTPAVSLATLRRSLRTWCALVAAIWLAGHVGSALHPVFVQHVTCVEHGELVHGTAEMLTHDGARPATERAALTTAADDDHHGHDHCEVATLARTAATLCQPAVTPAVACDVQASVIIVDAALPAAWDVLQLAPKTSPPA